MRMVVPDAYRDRNGHMNMRWYLANLDDAGDAVQVRLGLTPEYHHHHMTGTFDLEHHLRFVSEVLPNDHVAVYARLIVLSAKRLHYLMFMVNETRATLVATLECMTTFVDLTVRRTAAFPPGNRREDWSDAGGTCHAWLERAPVRGDAGLRSAGPVGSVNCVVGTRTSFSAPNCEGFVVRNDAIQPVTRKGSVCQPIARSRSRP